MKWLIVFLGGGLGSLARFAISLIFNKLGNNFPLSTLVSNVIACFLIGILTALVARGNLSDSQRLLWATGFCGGFSTFSTFSNETLELLNNGQSAMAFVNIGLSFVLCLAATYVGLKFF